VSETARTLGVLIWDTSWVDGSTNRVRDIRQFRSRRESGRQKQVSLLLQRSS
jgi:hypothetical protein